MVSQAEIITNFLRDEWNLTGELSKVPTDNMKEIVYFIDRKQVEGNEQTKVITVEKINAEENEDAIEHPTFVERSDKYIITLFYRVVDVQQPSFSDALDQVEKMATETQRIINLAYNPATSVGPYFLKHTRWEKYDMTDQAQPQLERKMILTLSNLASNNPEVFVGYGGILVFDVSGAEGDNLPAQDYEYTEVQDVSINEGWNQIAYLTKDKSKGYGIPDLQRGIFSGVYRITMQAKRADIEGTTLDKVYNMYLPQLDSPLIGQQAQIIFIHTNSNNENPQQFFSTRSYMKVNNVEKTNGVESLIGFVITGTLTRPTEAIIS